MSKLDIISPGTVAALVIICGILLYQTVLDVTWTSYRRIHQHHSSSSSSSSQRILHNNSHNRQHTGGGSVGGGRRGRRGGRRGGGGGGGNVTDNASIFSDNTHNTSTSSTIMSAATTEYDDEYDQYEEREEDNNPIARACPPLIGTMVIILLGLSWQGMALLGASSPMSPLSSNCEAVVNDGHWFHINPCSEHDLGIASRLYDVASFAHCEEDDNKNSGSSSLSSSAASSLSQSVWGWTARDGIIGTGSGGLLGLLGLVGGNSDIDSGVGLSRPHCRFSHRGPEAIQTQLRNKHVVFVGDAMTRNLFHALCRAVEGNNNNFHEEEVENENADRAAEAEDGREKDGEGGTDKKKAEAGIGSGARSGSSSSSSIASMYDASIPQHSDITRYIENDNILLEYKWAPLAMDEVNKLRQYGTTKHQSPPQDSQTQQEQEQTQPDLIVIGGGSWDRLHVMATDEDDESHKQSILSLGKEMTKLKLDYNIPTVWFVPTTINTRALNNEELRLYMNEDEIANMRLLYHELGISNAASFVLDGRAFTNDVVNESFDGVQYPPRVYDAGIQILANALDWILLRTTTTTTNNNAEENDTLFDPPSPGAMSNPFLGLMMLCFTIIGLFFFDGYLGFSYLGAIFVNRAMPSDLYEEAFIPLHNKYKLPPVSMDDYYYGDGSGGGHGGGMMMRGGRNVEEEVLGLLSGVGSSGGSVISGSGSSVGGGGVGIVAAGGGSKDIEMSSSASSSMIEHHHHHRHQYKR